MTLRKLTPEEIRAGAQRLRKRRAKMLERARGEMGRQIARVLEAMVHGEESSLR